LIDGRFQDICNYCYPAVIDKIIEINHGTPVKKITYEQLEIKNKELEKIINSSNQRFEEQLDLERSTNLEMLENLKTLNEKKYNDRLEISLREKTQRIEFLEKLLLESSSQRKLELLEQKFNELETKHSEFTVENFEL
jgi:hypothetical protein